MKINIQIEVALIAACSAILGSLVPQVFAHITKKESYKDELRKEYKANKVKAYQRLSEIIITMWTDDVKLDSHQEWLTKSITELENYKISHGIWIEDEEITKINDIQNKLADISAKEILGNYEYKKGESLSVKVEALQSLCRNKLKEEFYII